MHVDKERSLLEKNTGVGRKKKLPVATRLAQQEEGTLEEAYDDLNPYEPPSLEKPRVEKSGRPALPVQGISSGLLMKPRRGAPEPDMPPEISHLVSAGNSPPVLLRGLRPDVQLKEQYNVID